MGKIEETTKYTVRDLAWSRAHNTVIGHAKAKVLNPIEKQIDLPVEDLIRPLVWRLFIAIRAMQLEKRT